MNCTNVIYDMETSDPDDFLTLCFLSDHPNVKLVGVTVTPGSQEQIGLVRRLLTRTMAKLPPIGSFDPARETGCVSAFHYKLGMPFGPEKADATGAEVIAQCLKTYNDVTLLTGGPLKNLHQFLKQYPDLELPKWVGQGGFAGDSLVAPENRLAKFAGRETCPTFNFNGDPQGAILALASHKIGSRTLVSKNVCHGTLYDEAFHKRYEPYAMHELEAEDGRVVNLLGAKIIYQTMTTYLKDHPRGKMLHDPLAACVMLDPSVCTFEEVAVYRSKGEWGSRKQAGTGTWISVSVDLAKFENVFFMK